MLCWHSWAQCTFVLHTRGIYSALCYIGASTFLFLMAGTNKRFTDKEEVVEYLKRQLPATAAPAPACANNTSTVAGKPVAGINRTQHPAHSPAAGISSASAPQARHGIGAEARRQGDGLVLPAAKKARTSKAPAAGTTRPAGAQVCLTNGVASTGGWLCRSAAEPCDTMHSWCGCSCPCFVPARPDMVTVIPWQHSTWFLAIAQHLQPY